MRRLTALAATLLALGVIAGCGGDGDGIDVPARRVPVEVDPPGSPRTLGPLTERQRKESRRIIARDDQFMRIVGQQPYRFKRIVPWGTEDRTGAEAREVFIGTFSEIVLVEPRRLLVADWPLVDYPEDDAPAYAVRTARLIVRGLRSLLVNVDLKRNRLAAMSPFKTDEVRYPPNWPVRTVPSGE